MHRSLNLRNVLIISIPFLFIFNEYLIYYLWIFNCNWPDEGDTKVMIFADTHLLGVLNGHWFDKLRREWQMYIGFQTALFLLKPDAVFFLGDLFDEGQWGGEKQFKKYVDRFNDLFYVPANIKRFAVMGNHDIGFHYAISPQNMERFAKSFGLERGIEHMELNGNHFVLLNSMAMEGDQCALCGKAVDELDKISSAFQCLLNKTSKCSIDFKTPYGRPIVMQHFPLYRTSDEECLETDDLAPKPIREEKFRPKWECLSSESTQLLLNKLKPRGVFGGHVHYGCQKWWKAPHNFWEYTLASFSWRNNPQPSFMLASISPHQLQVDRCFIPHESFVIYTYYVFAFMWSLCLLLLLKRRCLPIEKLKNRLLRKISKPKRFVY